MFLLALVTIASMMPVEKLPPASWQSTLSLGFISAVFDNIPLTALALKQGGYDWGMLAYAVGFGGSMIWFGSSAGVAISNMYPEAKSVGRWVRHGWHVALAYVIGFMVFMVVTGWHPTDKRGRALISAPPVAEEVLAVGSVIVAASRLPRPTSTICSCWSLVCRGSLSRPRRGRSASTLGIGALFAASVAAALLAWTVPPRFLAWLGVLPIAPRARHAGRNPEREEKPLPPASGRSRRGRRNNRERCRQPGGLHPALRHETGPRARASWPPIFAVMTGLWCAAARWLVVHPGRRRPVRRYGPTAVPYVLIGIGLWILLR